MMSRFRSSILPDGFVSPLAVRAERVVPRVALLARVALQSPYLVAHMPTWRKSDEFVPFGRGSSSCWWLVQYPSRRGPANCAKPPQRKGTRAAWVPQPGARVRAT